MPLTALAKWKPWARADRPVDLGANDRAVTWASSVRETSELLPSEYDVLRVVASWTRPDDWSGFRLCISWIVERVRWSRRTVEKALASLKLAGFLLRDGQVPVEFGRPVVKYRLGGTPECPLPEDVWTARETEPVEDETAGRGGNSVYQLQTEGSSYVEGEGESPSLIDSTSDNWGSIYRSAEPIKTRPHVDVSRSYAGGVRHQDGTGKAFRAVVEAAVRRARGIRSRRDARSRLVGSPQLPQVETLVYSETKIPVTYRSHVTPSGGATMNPFAHPNIGTLPRDTRLLYLGLTWLHQQNPNTPHDPRFLKAELFRYDEDITPDVIADMLQTLNDRDLLTYTAPQTVRSTGILPYDLVAPNRHPFEASDSSALFDVPATRKKHTPAYDTAALFEVFWSTYPRRTGKGAARKSFLGAVGNGADPRQIIEAAAVYARNCQNIGKEAQFIPHPSTWLNQERWEDDLEKAPEVRSKMDDAMRQGMQLVQMYEQQERLEGGSAPLAIDWSHE